MLTFQKLYTSSNLKKAALKHAFILPKKEKKHPTHINEVYLSFAST